MADEAQAQAEEAIVDVLFGPEETVAEEPVVEEAVTEEPEEEEREVKPEVEGDDTSDEDTSDLVEVEWDGQLIEAPKAIADALMRQSDYTQKTQEVAAQRKAVEVQIGEVELRAQQYAFAQAVNPDIMKAQQLEQQAEQAHQYLRENIDTLTSTEIEKIRIAVDDSRRERDQLVQSMQQKHNEFQQAQEQSRQELLNKGTEVLRSKIPNWGAEAQKQVQEYALASGYTEAEVSQVVDPRQVETLWKASQYEALQQGKAAAVRKVQDAPSIKPKSRNPMPQKVKDKLNLRKKLKSEKLTNADKAGLIGESIADKFF